MILLRSILLLSLCISASLSGGVREVVEAIENISIKSLTQEIIGDIARFSGNVDVLVDDKMHLWAGIVTIDQKAKTLTAEPDEGKLIIIEAEDFFMFATRVELSLQDRTGHAEKVRVHFGGTYVAAAKAQRLSNGDWSFDDVMYTGCDHPTPHWSFAAHHAKLHSDSVQCSGLLFKIGRVPIMGVPSLTLPAPKFAIPKDEVAKSGFLFPGFSYSSRLGIGIDPAYYQTLGAHADTTMGLKWIEKKGYVYHHEARWGKQPESYSWVYGQYVKEFRAFKEKEHEIVKGHSYRYWLEGEHFQSFHLGTMHLQTLSRIDSGTDKQIGYDFFYKAHAVEDRFLNSAVVRWWQPKHVVILKGEAEKVFREQFTITDDEKLENEDKLSVTRAPHAWWNSAFTRIGSLFCYKHELFADSIFFHHHVRENVFDGSKIVARKEVNLLPSDNTSRLYYEGTIRTDFRARGQSLYLALKPNVQMRGRLQDTGMRAHRNVIENSLGSQGAYRLFLSSQAEWALPEVTFHTPDFSYVHYMQPFLRFTWVPRFRQDHWFFADEYDRVFPEQSVVFELRNNWILKETEVDLTLRTGYEFFPKSDIFPIRRSPTAKHFLPFSLQLNAHHGPVYVGISQEFDAANAQLVQSEIDFSFSVSRIDVSLSWIYQSPRLQRERELLADVPSFGILEVSMPFTDTLQIGYGSHLFSKKNSPFAWMQDRNALLHRVHISHSGHCWGLSLGFEEKRFRQQGELKGERQYYFSFKLDSLVSLTKSFKQEPITIMQAPEGF